MLKVARGYHNINDVERRSQFVVLKHLQGVDQVSKLISSLLLPGVTFVDMLSCIEIPVHLIFVVKIFLRCVITEIF